MTSSMAKQKREIPRHFDLKGWRGYLAAFILVGLALLMSLALPANTAAPYYLSILLAALWGGRGPGITAAVLSSAATAYYDLGTGGQFDLNVADLLRLVIFFVLALITSALVVSQRQTEAALREMVDELEALERAKDEFIATITHDLRSPLTSILGWAELLRLRETQDDEMMTAVDSIVRSARVQSRLVDDLLEASRAQLGKIEMKREIFDLVILVDGVLDSFSLESQRQNIALRRAVESESVAFTGDPQRIEQLLRNLVSNALKFTSEGGEVAVGLAASDGSVHLEVCDSGVGIAPDILPTVFDRFVQARGAGEKGGLGLGLAIVRHIAELHGGSVEARSEGEGRGARFIVELPREAPSDREGLLHVVATGEEAGALTNDQVSETLQAIRKTDQ